MPDLLPRFVALPRSDGARRFAMLEDVIRDNLGQLFPGVGIRTAHMFRVVRDMEVAVNLENDGAPQVYIGSADLMERNLNKRVEAVCPVLDTELAQFLRHVVLEAYLRDNIRARVLQPDGKYVPVERDGAPFDAQYTMMSRRLRAILARERLGDQLQQ